MKKKRNTEKKKQINREEVINFLEITQKGIPTFVKLDFVCRDVLKK